MFACAILIVFSCEAWRGVGTAICYSRAQTLGLFKNKKAFGPFFTQLATTMSGEKRLRVLVRICVSEMMA